MSSPLPLPSDDEHHDGDGHGNRPTTTSPLTTPTLSTTPSRSRQHRRSLSGAIESSTTTASSPSTSSVATIRRLSDDDVRAVFECLHHQAPLPSRLAFTIVPVGPNGLKLSPPSYEFEDGLYVLLRPPKKVKPGQSLLMPRAPSHLQHLVADENHWAETCPWSLSGPQFPQPTAIQQRYCYPKGNQEYSSRVGGALWTMYSADTAKEDLEFRLLHVYFSAKRAVNKGIKTSRRQSTTPKTPSRTPSPQRRSRSQWAQQQPREQHQPQLTMTPNQMTPPPLSRPPSMGFSGICHSPLSSFDWSSPSPVGTSQQHSHQQRQQQPQQLFHHHHPGSNWVVTPQVSDLFRRRRHPPATPGSSTFSTPSPIRKRGRTSYDEAESPPEMSQQQQQQQHHQQQICSSKSLDALDMETSLHDIDSYWNDPLMNILMQPSADAGRPATPLVGSHASTLSVSTRTLSQRLGVLHEKIREMVSDDLEAASVVKDWAETLAIEFKGKVQV